MESEIEDITTHSETEKFIEKALARQRTKIYEHFNEILTQLTSSLGLALISNPMRFSFDRIFPFKVQMNLAIPNLEGKIDAEFMDNQIQQLKSYFFVNQLFEVEKVTIASLKMLISIHYWWENILTNEEEEGHPIDT